MITGHKHVWVTTRKDGERCKDCGAELTEDEVFEATRYVSRDERSDALSLAAERKLRRQGKIP